MFIKPFALALSASNEQPNYRAPAVPALSHIVRLAFGQKKLKLHFVSL